MAKSKKPRRAYNPRRYAPYFPWWHIDDKERVAGMNTDFGLRAHYGLEQLRNGALTKDVASTLGALLRTARQLTKYMNDAEKLEAVLSKAEGAMMEVHVLVSEGKPYDKRYVPFVEEGIPCALDVIKNCSLREVHAGLEDGVHAKTIVRMTLDDKA